MALEDCRKNFIKLCYVFSDSASPLWLHSDLYPTPEWPSEDTLHFGGALSVTSSITTPAPRQQVHPLSLPAAALFSFCPFVYIDMPLLFSLFLSSLAQSSHWFWLVHGCQTWQITVFPHFASLYCHLFNPSPSHKTVIWWRVSVQSCWTFLSILKVTGLESIVLS